MLVIESDMLMQAHVTVVGTVILNGRLEGSIVCSRLEIGEDGYLLGDAVVEDLIVAGQILGSARGKRVHLKQTALVEGELFHEVLSMDAAATLVGVSRRQSGADMPAAFKSLEQRVNRTEEEFRAIELATRVRMADQAERTMPEFEALKTRLGIALRAATPAAPVVAARR